MKAFIALEDGTIFEGISFGAQGERLGEIVFNTSMSGYQEIMTDPSYKGQIVTMTYPLIGNYGINKYDVESSGPKVEGFIIKESSKIASNFRSEKSLGQYLKENNIIGIENVDTRSLTLHIRTKGAMKGIISTIDLNPKSLIKKAKNSPGLIGRDLVKEVTCKKSYNAKTVYSLSYLSRAESKDALRQNARFKVIAMDFGIKYNILRCLMDIGCDVTVVPCDTKAKDILAQNPDGIFLSNGPGDPAAVTYAIEEIRKLLGKKPIFGICLGHQLLGLAFGGKTYKLKFGHRGANHPVKDLKTGKIDITSQNHGFCVDIDSLNKDEIELTHINLNDNTLEGMTHRKLPIFSVQYHPEASPGPHDSRYLFKRFVEIMEQYAKKN
ncbi:MAG: carbamoyl phosphate synthase small subunit [Omnitrophica bacterium GWA2_41_15]|nr:MAG: carbamoyl phosphate synthase small subunit [Omnitrophica bacterium GWA2_41_15]HAZ11073.1 carbamoyl phosphate synthase small subunit [Candidatus Omnitrophota bacterium]